MKTTMKTTGIEVPIKLKHVPLSNLAKFTTVVSAPTDLIGLSYSLGSDGADNSKFQLTTNTMDAR
jgi:hypothetical protein